MKRRSIHVKRAYILRDSGRRREARKRKIKLVNGINCYRQYGPDMKNALWQRHVNRILFRRFRGEL
jgi:hypothetical protein